MHTGSLALALSVFVIACKSASDSAPIGAATDFMVTTLAGSEADGYVDGKGTAAVFSTPVSLVCDRQGTVFAAEPYNNVIRRITPDGTVTTAAGGGGGRGDAWSASKDPLLAALKRPAYLALATNADLLISESGDRYYDKTNVLFRILSAGNGITNYTYVNPPATFNNQTYYNGGVVQDKAGNYYLLEGDHIRKITPQGSHIPNWVTDIDWEGSVFTGNQFAIDANGTLFFPTGGFNALLKGAITKVTADGAVSYTKDGPVGSKVVNGKLIDVDLGFVRMLTTDSHSNLYVVTSGDAVDYDRILKISPDEVVTFVAGGTGNAFRDGIGKTAQFQKIAGLAIDDNGIIYVSDFDRIRKINPMP